MTAIPYRVLIAPKAKQRVHSLDAKQQKNFLKIADTLGINPRPPGAQRIEGLTGLYCQVVENLKIVYKVEEHDILVLLVE